MEIMFCKISVLARPFVIQGTSERVDFKERHDIGSDLFENRGGNLRASDIRLPTTMNVPCNAAILVVPRTADPSESVKRFKTPTPRKSNIQQTNRALTQQ